MTHALGRPTSPTRGLCTRPHAALTAQPHGGLVLPHEEDQVRPASRTEHGPQTHNRPPDALAQPSRCSELPGPKPGRPDGRRPAPQAEPQERPPPRPVPPRPMVWTHRAAGRLPRPPCCSCPAPPPAPTPAVRTCRGSRLWTRAQRGSSPREETASACRPHGALTSNPAPRTRPASPPPVAHVPPTLRAGGFLPESPVGTARGPRDRVNTRAQQPPQRTLTRVSI